MAKLRKPSKKFKKSRGALAKGFRFGKARKGGRY